MRVRDPILGRMRGAQRAGLSKFCPAAIGSGKIKALCSTATDDRKIAYSFTAGQETTPWSQQTPSKSNCIAGRTDRSGNVYALDGAAGIAKFNSAGRLVMKIALPVADKAHVVRALWVDESDRIFAGVSEGGDVRTAKVFCVLQRPAPGTEVDDPNQYQVLWELTPGAYTESLRVYRASQLYAAHNYPLENRARVLVYENLALQAEETARIDHIAYPVSDMTLGADGSVYCSSPDAQRSVVDTGPRLGDPSVAKSAFTHPPLVGWLPTDGAAAGDFVIGSWFDGDDPDSLGEADVEDGELEDGKEVLRWRDKSGNGRHYYAGSLEVVGETGPEYRKRGIAGRPCLFFRNVGSFKNSLVSVGNASVEAVLASQQRTPVPGYTGGMWCMFLVFRPTQDDDATTPSPRTLWAMKNEAGGGASDHVLFVNRDCGAVVPGVYSKGNVSYYATTDNTGDAGQCAGPTPQALAFPFKDFGTPDVAGAVIVTVLWDGGVQPNDTTKTRCLFRVNGRPVDRFEGLAFETTQPSWLGAAPTTIFATGMDIARRFQGELAEKIVIWRKDPTSTTEPKVLSYDAFEKGTADTAQTDNSVTRIEAYLAYKWGLGQILRNNEGAEVGFGNFTHFYARNNITFGAGNARVGGPPKPGVGGLYAPFGQLLNTFALVSKHDSQGVLQWVWNWCTHDDTTAAGGVGYAVEARTIDGVTAVWSLGSQPAYSNSSLSASTIDVRKVIDQGADFSGLAADGAWKHSWAGGAELTYFRPKVRADKFGNLFVPGHNTGAGTIRTLTVLELAPSAGLAVVLSEVLLPSGSSLAFAVALPPDELVPDYRTDLTVKVADVAYLFAATKEAADPDSVWKVQLVSVASVASGSPRTVVTLAVVEDDIKTLDEVGVTVPSGGSGAVDATSQYVSAFQADREIVVVDGLGYKAYSLLDGTVSTLEATSAGEIPPRAKLGCMWRHRLVLARMADKPGRYAASAIGDIRDWNFRPPVSLSTQAFDASLTRAGEVEDSIVALIPYSDDLLFVLGESRILRLTGDPMDGGQIDKVSDDIGGTFGLSWCKDAAGRAFFFGNPPGLYLLDPQAGPQSLTRYTIEETELAEIDFSTHRIELAWDPIQKGVAIYQVPHGAGGTIVNSWFYEEKTHALVKGGAIWTDRAGSASVQATASSFLAGDSTRGLLIGCEDGYVRMVDPAAKDDDGVPIDSFVLIGPINRGASMLEHRLNSTQVVLADDRQGAHLEIFGSEDGVQLGPILASTDLRPGLNNPFRARARSANLFLRIRSALAGRSWAFERAEADLVAVGSQFNRTS